MEDLQLSSPGRLCLLGDHCDWAGGYCLAAPIHLRIRAVGRARLDRLLVVESTLGASTLRGSYSLDEPGYVPDDPLRYASAAVAVLRDRGFVLKGLDLRVESELPAKRGLGSSAAFTLLVIKGLTRVAEIALPPREMAELAYVAERELLGIPCGRMDQMASVHSRPVFLDFATPDLRVEEIDTPGAVHLALGDCGGIKDTELILQDLNRCRTSSPPPPGRPSRTAAQNVAYAFDELFPELVKRGRDALLAGDLRRLGEAMTVCQAVYDEYLRPATEALASPLLKNYLGVCRRAGALGQKWTGSGGDGAFLALAEDEKHQEEIVHAIREAGGTANAVRL